MVMKTLLGRSNCINWILYESGTSIWNFYCLNFLPVWIYNSKGSLVRLYATRLPSYESWWPRFAYQTTANINLHWPYVIYSWLNFSVFLGLKPWNTALNSLSNSKVEMTSNSSTHNPHWKSCTFILSKIDLKGDVFPSNINWLLSVHFKHAIANGDILHNISLYFEVEI